MPTRTPLAQMVDGGAGGEQRAMSQPSSTVATHVEADPRVCSNEVRKAGQLPQQAGFRVLNGPRNLQGTEQIKKICKTNINFVGSNNLIKIRTLKRRKSHGMLRRPQRSRAHALALDRACGRTSATGRSSMHE